MARRQSSAMIKLRKQRWKSMLLRRAARPNPEVLAQYFERTQNLNPNIPLPPTLGLSEPMRAVEDRKFLEQAPMWQKLNELHSVQVTRTRVLDVKMYFSGRSFFLVKRDLRRKVVCRTHVTNNKKLLLHNFWSETTRWIDHQKITSPPK